MTPEQHQEFILESNQHNFNHLVNNMYIAGGIGGNASQSSLEIGVDFLVKKFEIGTLDIDNQTKGEIIQLINSTLKDLATTIKFSYPETLNITLADYIKYILIKD